MRIVERPVYYCDFCRRYRLSSRAMEKHEAICTLNPSRVCRWRIDGHSDGTRVVEIAPLAAELLSRATGSAFVGLTVRDIDWLRRQVEGCPACMLASLRQSGVDEYHRDRDRKTIFDYTDEVARLRAQESEGQEYL